MSLFVGAKGLSLVQEPTRKIKIKKKEKGNKENQEKRKGKNKDKDKERKGKGKGGPRNLREGEVMVLQRRGREDDVTIR